MSTTLIPEIQDIVQNADERELWIVGREFERPPYHHAGKGGDTRLARALRVCLDNRIAPNSDGTYLVEGSEHRTYRVGDSCSCPQSQKANSKWCYHAVAVALYIEWQRRLRGSAPVALGTLRAGTLPLGEEKGVRNEGGREEGDTPTPAPSLPAAPSPVRITVDGIDYPPHMPQEARMADDAYTSEPENLDTATATLEAPTPVPALRPRTTQVDDLEAALQVWTTERAVVQRFLKQELKANIDYYTLRIGGKDSKPSLSKAGAEKVLGWLKIQASFLPDTGTWEMLGRPTDLVSFVCTLRTRSGEIVGEGRGARSLKKDGGDVNKAIKMAEKSAMVSAVLRTGALSDVFTQDLEDMQEPEPVKPAMPSAAMRSRIWALVQQLAPEAKTREEVERFIQDRTGYMLLPNQYAAILTALEASA
jgi:hypothetical protein